MPKYIDAEKLEMDGWSASRSYQQDAKTMVYETKKMTDFPTADVPDRNVGEWIKKDGTTVCSACGLSLEDWIQAAFYNYCPNCGAEMRGEEDE